MTSTSHPAARVRPEFSLGEAPVRTPLTLRRSDGTADFRRRLSALGLRVGARVTVVHQTVGGGRIVAVAGARIALDRDVLARLVVESAA
ncbi:MAG TPA: FeoA family protein [Propionibacteriaceae bacterium]|nr:FeoA family protein [Propionibacteriaceae bacterium]